jgi:hypothetical protein
VHLVRAVTITTGTFRKWLWHTSSLSELPLINLTRNSRFHVCQCYNVTSQATTTKHTAMFVTSGCYKFPHDSKRTRQTFELGNASDLSKLPASRFFHRLLPRCRFLTWHAQLLPTGLLVGHLMVPFRFYFSSITFFFHNFFIFRDFYVYRFFYTTHPNKIFYGIIEIFSHRFLIGL